MEAGGWAPLAPPHFNHCLLCTLFSWVREIILYGCLASKTTASKSFFSGSSNVAPSAGPCLDFLCCCCGGVGPTSVLRFLPAASPLGPASTKEPCRSQLPFLKESSEAPPHLQTPSDRLSLCPSPLLQSSKTRPMSILLSVFALPVGSTACDLPRFTQSRVSCCFFAEFFLCLHKDHQSSSTGGEVQIAIPDIIETPGGGGGVTKECTVLPI